jgi:hypothetical protein
LASHSWIVTSIVSRRAGRLYAELAWSLLGRPVALCRPTGYLCSEPGDRSSLWAVTGAETDGGWRSRLDDHKLTVASMISQRAGRVCAQSAWPVLDRGRKRSWKIRAPRNFGRRIWHPFFHQARIFRDHLEILFSPRDPPVSPATTAPCHPVGLARRRAIRSGSPLRWRVGRPNGVEVPLATLLRDLCAIDRFQRIRHSPGGSAARIFSA